MFLKFLMFSLASCLLLTRLIISVLCAVSGQFVLVLLIINKLFRFCLKRRGVGGTNLPLSDQKTPLL